MKRTKEMKREELRSSCFFLQARRPKVSIELSAFDEWTTEAVSTIALSH